MIVEENPLKLSYKFQKFRINHETIKEFEYMARARQLRKSQVDRLKKRIIDGKHFDSPIIINEIGKKKRIIDGQHRIRAISEIIKEHIIFEIDILLVVYQDLKNLEEKEIFERWNSGTRQSAEDYLMIYTDEIPIYDILKDKGIVSIYSEETKIKFKQLVNPYIQAKIRNVSLWLRPSEFVEQAKKLGKKDAEEMETYLVQFRENTGLLEKSNNFYKSTMFGVLMYLYFIKEEKDEEFWAKFNEKVKDNKKILELSQTGGVSASVLIKESIEKLMYGRISEMETVRKQPKKWDDEKVKFIRERYEKTDLSIEDIVHELEVEFRVETSVPALRGVMNYFEIRKDPKWEDKTLDKKRAEGKISRKIFTKTVLDFMRKCSKTMDWKEAYEATRVEMGGNIAISSFRQTAYKNGIMFLQKDILGVKVDDKTLAVIKKHQDLKIWEIIDKIIEAGIKQPEPGVIAKVLMKMRAEKGEPRESLKIKPSRSVHQPVHDHRKIEPEDSDDDLDLDEVLDD